jgi:hypothetical protein
MDIPQSRIGRFADGTMEDVDPPNESRHGVPSRLRPLDVHIGEVSESQEVDRQPQYTNWTDADVCAFHGFSSIEKLMAVPGFPEPIPYPLRGRRWNPADHLAFRAGLAGKQYPDAGSVPDLPLFDERAFLLELRKLGLTKMRPPGRPKNPDGDPVHIYTRTYPSGTVRYFVRYYPSGRVTAPNDRRQLKGAYLTREEAESAADELRENLLSLRSQT